MSNTTYLYNLETKGELNRMKYLEYHIQDLGLFGTYDSERLTKL